MSEPSVDLPSDAGPLARPAFRWFLAGHSISQLGTSLSSVALAFAVLDASGSAADLGLVLAAHSLAMIAFVLAGGVVADRLPRITVLIVSHVGAGLTQAAMAGLLLFGSFDLRTAAALSALNGLLTGFTMPALRGIVPDLVSGAALQRANALLSTSNNATRLLGPASAGVLAATVGGGWALAIDAVSYLIAAVCLARVVLPSSTIAASTSMLGDLRDGWLAFRSLTWVWVVTCAFLLINAVQQGAWAVLGPTIARGTFGEASWGLVVSSRAVGLLMASVVLYRMVTVRHPLRAGQACTALLAAPLVLLGAGAPIGWLIAAACIAGAGSAVAGISWATALQEHIPRAQLSRVSSYDNLGSFIAMPVGQAVAGPLALAFGSSGVVVAGAVLLVLAALLPLTVRSIRDLQHVPAGA